MKARPMNLRLTEEVDTFLRQLAHERNETLTEVIENAILAHYSVRPPPKPPEQSLTADEKRVWDVLTNFGKHPRDPGYLRPMKDTVALKALTGLDTRRTWSALKSMEARGLVRRMAFLPPKLDNWGRDLDLVFTVPKAFQEFSEYRAAVRKLIDMQEKTKEKLIAANDWSPEDERNHKETLAKLEARLELEE